MNDIPLKILIVDPESGSRSALAKVLRTMDVVLAVKCSDSLAAAQDELKKTEINAIYIDPISLGLEAASAFVFGIRKVHPTIVFVLYCDAQKQKREEEHFFGGERHRWRHYFFLDKATSPMNFSRSVQETLTRCQGDLAMTLTREKIAGLQKELISIQEEASDDKATVPIQTIKDMLEQLAARTQETKSATGHRPAEFLGPCATKLKGDRCFVIMPYSQAWSKGVEEILQECCEAAGVEFTIAKAMEGRFVAHDIWQGITGSGVIIADLSGANANVSYEIGLADAIGREVILIAQDSKVPFDFSGQRLILYENSVEGALKLRKEVTARLKQTVGRLTPSK
jgi:hypothetical protein